MTRVTTDPGVLPLIGSNSFWKIQFRKKANTQVRPEVADLLIGMFGQLEILVDPYTDFAKGTVGVRALQSIDIAVRHAESFAAMTDAIA